MEQEQSKETKGAGRLVDRNYLHHQISANSGISVEKVRLVLNTFWMVVWGKVLKGKIVRLPYMRWFVAITVRPNHNIKTIHQDRISTHISFTDKRAFYGTLIVKEFFKKKAERMYRSGKVKYTQLDK